MKVEFFQFSGSDTDISMVRIQNLVSCMSVCGNPQWYDREVNSSLIPLNLIQFDTARLYWHGCKSNAKANKN